MAMKRFKNILVRMELQRTINYCKSAKLKERTKKAFSNKL